MCDVLRHIESFSNSKQTIIRRVECIQYVIVDVCVWCEMRQLNGLVNLNRKKVIH